MSTYRVERKSVAESGGRFVAADIRKMLNADCEYLWDDRHEVLLEKWPDGEVFQVIFHVTCERKQAIRFDLTKPKSQEKGSE